MSMPPSPPTPGRIPFLVITSHASPACYRTYCRLPLVNWIRIFFFSFCFFERLSFCTFPITSIKYLSYQEKMVNNTEGKEILPNAKAHFKG